MKKFIKTLFVFIVYLSLLPQSASANAPIPEYGKARGTIDIPCVLPPPAWRYPGEKEGAMITHTITIDFWNVGKAGGDQYEYVAVTTEYSGKNSSCSRGGTHGDKFDGGPNGKFQAFGRMVNGKYIEVTWNGGTSNIPVLTPEVFSKYDWAEGATKSTLEDSGAAFSDVFGQVEVSIPRPDGTFDEESWDLAKLDGKTLPVGTHIKTSEKSGGIISFADMTTFTLKPETEIVLSSPSAKDSAIKILWGNLMVNVKKMMKDGSMEVEMSQAVAGIKGTTFILEETGDTSTLKVIEGTVSYISKTTDDTEMVNSGETITATKDGLGQKLSFDVETENKRWDNQTDNSEETSSKAGNYLYYLGIPIVFAGIITFILTKRKKLR